MMRGTDVQQYARASVCAALIVPCIASMREAAAQGCGNAQAAEEADAASELLAKVEAALEELQLAESMAAQQGEAVYDAQGSLL